MTNPDTPRAARPASRSMALRLATIAFSATLLYLLYVSIDARAVVRVLANADAWWLALALLLLIPITLMRAVRFYWLAPPGSVSGVAEAISLTLVASAVNMFVPGKAGDFTKSWVLTRRGGIPIGITTSVVIFERVSDIVGLILWCLAGYALVRPVAPLLPPATWATLAVVALLAASVLLSLSLARRLARVGSGIATSGRVNRVLRELPQGWLALLSVLGARRWWLVVYAILLWFVQLIQIWLFTITVGAKVSPAISASLSGIALLIGQLPITVGGIGARDMALVLLLSGYMAPEQAAAVGVLTASRNLLPPLAALPVLRRYTRLIVPGA